MKRGVKLPSLNEGMGRKNGYDGIGVSKTSLFFLKKCCVQIYVVVIYIGTDKWTLSSAGRATDS